MARKPTLKSAKKAAWKACSEYVRKSAADRDGIVECYTCGKRAHWKKMQAGHAVPGRGNAVLCELDALRVQCYSCNICKHGEHHVFLPKLIKELGMERVDEIIALRHISVKRDIEYWQEKRSEFEQKTEELKCG